MTAPIPIRPADAFSRYAVEARIGEGAFATTYRARDTVLGRTVALKVLRREFAAEPAFLARFLREARAAAAVDHPNVVHVYDYGEDGGAYYLALQYIPGRTLKAAVDEEAPFAPADAVRLALQVLDGLGAIHAAGIVHRDIKPQNVLLGRGGVARITDFGIAHDGSGVLLTRLTSYGTTIGTPAYMAPEQARGEAVTQATDLYAVGVVLFELLTGRLPFEADNPMAVMLAHLQQEPPVPSRAEPAIPAALDRVVLRAMAKQPADRFPSAPAMARALADALHAPQATPPAGTGTVREPTAPPDDHEASTRAVADGSPTALPSVAGSARAPGRVLPAPPRRDRAARGRLPWVVPLLVCGLAVALLAAALVRAFRPGDDGNGGNVAGETPAARALAGSAAPTDAPAVPTPSARATQALVFLATDALDPTATSPPATARPTEPPVEPTARPRPTRTPRPRPTREPTPEPTEEPEAAPVPTEEPAPAPTDAPAAAAEAPDEAPAQPVSLAFGAADWQGGYYRGDAQWYGRAWVALYGAQSGYARASVTFFLDAAPSGGGALTIVGLDDESGGDNPLSITVNGVEVFAGPSPFPGWDGVGTGETAAWTAVTFAIPAGALLAGSNEVAVSNLVGGANFGSPPYVLVSDAAVTTEP